MSDVFTDVGNGWFLVEDSFGQQYVADCHARRKDHMYGPAAWNGGMGPLAGGALVKLTFVDYYKHMALLDECQYGDGEYPGECEYWPAHVEVTQAGTEAGLYFKKGESVEQDDFMREIQQCARKNGSASLELVTSQDRLVLARELLQGR